MLAVHYLFFIIHCYKPLRSSIPCFHKHKYTAVQYSEKLSKDKTLRISRFVPIHRSFLHKNWLGGHLATTASNPKKVFSEKILYSANLQKFCPLMLSPYAVYVAAGFQTFDLFINRSTGL